MSQPLVAKKKRNAISNGVFLIGLGVLFYTNFWWPGILLVLWATLVVRQYLGGRNFDAIISTIILPGLFLINFLQIRWNVLMPVLFVLGGIYIILREYFTEEEGEESP